jgi:hypothetical protein
MCIIKEGNKRIWATMGNTELMFAYAKVVENDVLYFLPGVYSHWTVISDYHCMIDHHLLSMIHVVGGIQQLVGDTGTESGVS